MYPTLVKFGNFEITTFGVMMFLAFIFAGMVLTRQFRRYGLSDDLASSIVFGAALGGILGAKIYFAILYHDIHALFSRAGLVWYGGFIGGVAVCSYIIRKNRVPFLLVYDGAAPALAIGYAIGRIGCFLVGDDYGRPTNSAIGIAFPKGLPPTTAQSLREFGAIVDPSIPGDTLLRVHPTQLYESVSAFVIFGILMFMARRPHHRGRIFAMFLVLASIERFLVEIVRAKDDRFLGPFTVAQLISVIIVIIGGALFAYAGRTPIDETPLPAS